MTMKVQWHRYTTFKFSLRLAEIVEIWKFKGFQAVYMRGVELSCIAYARNIMIIEVDQNTRIQVLTAARGS